MWFLAETYDWFWLSLANSAIFPTIRKKMIGRNLRALICGSAPLAIETQLFFMMLGIPVLPPYYSLQLLPYAVPNVETWKQRVFRERDFTDAIY